MRTIFSIIVLLLLFSGNSYNEFEDSSDQQSISLAMDKPPEFYVLEWEKGTQLTHQKTNFFIEVDSIGKQEVITLLNKKNEPVLYASNVVTPVCADGECKLMHIKLYWTLLGEYAGFDRYAQFPLSKYDHDEFALEDYKKLHDLLKDDKSILGRRSIEELVEDPKVRTVNGVDAISGATIAEVKESVVSGALYSCHTAWNIVHGNIKNKIKQHTVLELNAKILANMLHSNNAKYQMFALKQFDQNQFKEHYIRIAEVFTDGIPMIRNFIVKKISLKIWDSPGMSQPFWDALPKIDIGSRSLLLERLQYASQSVIEKISENLNILTKNQLRKYLESLSNLKFSPKLEENLIAFAESNEIYGYLVKEYLKEL